MDSEEELEQALAYHSQSSGGLYNPLNHDEATTTTISIQSNDVREDGREILSIMIRDEIIRNKLRHQYREAKREQRGDESPYLPGFFGFEHRSNRFHLEAKRINESFGYFTQNTGENQTDHSSMQLQRPKNFQQSIKIVSGADQGLDPQVPPLPDHHNKAYSVANHNHQFDHPASNHNSAQTEELCFGNNSRLAKDQRQLKCSINGRSAPTQCNPQPASQRDACIYSNLGDSIHHDEALIHHLVNMADHLEGYAEPFKPRVDLVTARKSKSVGSMISYKSKCVSAHFETEKKDSPTSMTGINQISNIDRLIENTKQEEASDMLSFEYRESVRRARKAAEEARELVRISRERQRAEMLKAFKNSELEVNRKESLRLSRWQSDPVLSQSEIGSPVDPSVYHHPYCQQETRQPEAKKKEETNTKPLDTAKDLTGLPPPAQQNLTSMDKTNLSSRRKPALKSNAPPKSTYKLPKQPGEHLQRESPRQKSNCRQRPVSYENYNRSKPHSFNNKEQQSSTDDSVVPLENSAVDPSLISDLPESLLDPLYNRRNRKPTATEKAGSNVDPSVIGEIKSANKSRGKPSKQNKYTVKKLVHDKTAVSAKTIAKDIIKTSELKSSYSLCPQVSRSDRRIPKSPPPRNVSRKVSGVQKDSFHTAISAPSMERPVMGQMTSQQHRTSTKPQKCSSNKDFKSKIDSSFSKSIEVSQKSKMANWKDQITSNIPTDISTDIKDEHRIKLKKSASKWDLSSSHCFTSDFKGNGEDDGKSLHRYSSSYLDDKKESALPGFILAGLNKLAPLIPWCMEREKEPSNELNSQLIDVINEPTANKNSAGVSKCLLTQTENGAPNNSSAVTEPTIMISQVPNQRVNELRKKSKAKCQCKLEVSTVKSEHCSCSKATKKDKSVPALPTEEELPGSKKMAGITGATKVPKRDDDVYRAFRYDRRNQSGCSSSCSIHASCEANLYTKPSCRHPSLDNLLRVTQSEAPDIIGKKKEVLESGLGNVPLTGSRSVPKSSGLILYTTGSSAVAAPRTPSPVSNYAITDSTSGITSTKRIITCSNSTGGNSTLTWDYLPNNSYHLKQDVSNIPLAGSLQSDDSDDDDRNDGDCSSENSVIDDEILGGSKRLYKVKLSDVHDIPTRLFIADDQIKSPSPVQNITRTASPTIHVQVEEINFQQGGKIESARVNSNVSIHHMEDANKTRNSIWSNNHLHEKPLLRYSDSLVPYSITSDDNPDSSSPRLALLNCSSTDIQKQNLAAPCGLYSGVDSFSTVLSSHMTESQQNRCLLALHDESSQCLVKKHFEDGLVMPNSNTMKPANSHSRTEVPKVVVNQLSVHSVQSVAASATSGTTRAQAKWLTKPEKKVVVKAVKSHSHSRLVFSTENLKPIYHRESDHSNDQKHTEILREGVTHLENDRTISSGHSQPKQAPVNQSSLKQQPVKQPSAKQPPTEHPHVDKVADKQPTKPPARDSLDCGSDICAPPSLDQGNSHKDKALRANAPEVNSSPNKNWRLALNEIRAKVFNSRSPKQRGQEFQLPISQQSSGPKSLHSVANKEVVMPSRRFRAETVNRASSPINQYLATADFQSPCCSGYSQSPTADNGVYRAVAPVPDVYGEPTTSTKQQPLAKALPQVLCQMQAAPQPQTTGQQSQLIGQPHISLHQPQMTTQPLLIVQPQMGPQPRMIMQEPQQKPIPPKLNHHPCTQHALDSMKHEPSTTCQPPFHYLPNAYQRCYAQHASDLIEREPPTSCRPSFHHQPNTYPSQSPQEICFSKPVTSSIPNEPQIIHQNHRPTCNTIPVSHSPDFNRHEPLAESTPQRNSALPTYNDHPPNISGQPAECLDSYRISCPTNSNVVGTERVCDGVVSNRSPADMLSAVNASLSQILTDMNNPKAQCSKPENTSMQSEVEVSAGASSNLSSGSVLGTLVGKIGRKMDQIAQKLYTSGELPKAQAISEANHIYRSMTDMISQSHITDLEESNYNQRELGHLMTSVACSLLSLCVYLKHPPQHSPHLTRASDSGRRKQTVDTDTSDVKERLPSNEAVLSKPLIYPTEPNLANVADVKKLKVTPEILRTDVQVQYKPSTQSMGSQSEETQSRSHSASRLSVRHNRASKGKLRVAPRRQSAPQSSSNLRTDSKNHIKSRSSMRFDPSLHRLKPNTQSPSTLSPAIRPKKASIPSSSTIKSTNRNKEKTVSNNQRSPIVKPPGSSKGRRRSRPR